MPACQHLQEDCWLPPVAGVTLLHQLQDKHHGPLLIGCIEHMPSQHMQSLT